VTTSALVPLVVGTVAGTPIGVWILANAPASLINRLIGLMLIVVAVLEWRRLYPTELIGRGWGLGAGFLAGILGGAVGTPGPPAIVYATTQPWSPRTIKANLQAFFFVNQVLILAGYWRAGLVTEEIGRLTLAFAIPAVVGMAAGVAFFGRINAVVFRRIVFALIFVSGLLLVARG